jgi:hypothetical protein
MTMEIKKIRQKLGEKPIICHNCGRMITTGLAQVITVNEQQVHVHVDRNGHTGCHR